MLSNSNPIWKNTLPIDSIQLTSQDSVIVPVKYRYIVASRMLYKNYCGQAKVINQQLFTIQSQEREIKFLNKENSLLRKNDSISAVKSKIDSTKLIDIKHQLINTQIDLKTNKTGKIIGAITTPLAALAGFLLGWFLNN